MTTTDRVIMVRESEWREMREALKQIAAETHGTVDDPDASRINRIARRALAHPTPDGCGREGKHQWGGPERNREVCVNCGATRVLEGGDDG